MVVTRWESVKVIQKTPNGNEKGHTARNPRWRLVFIRYVYIMCTQFFASIVQRGIKYNTFITWGKVDFLVPELARSFEVHDLKWHIKLIEIIRVFQYLLFFIYFINYYYLCIIVNLRCGVPPVDPMTTTKLYSIACLQIRYIISMKLVFRLWILTSVGLVFVENCYKYL